MLLDAGIDTGPVLLKRSITISDDDTTGTLTPKLAHLGAEALLEALPVWVAGKITPEPQNEEKASHTRMLQKEDGELHWDRPASILARQVRAFNPWPGAYTHWRGKLLKLHSTHALDLEPGQTIAPGTVTTREEVGHKVIAVVTGKGLLIIKQLQLEGKKAMSAEEFLRGYTQIVGDVLT